MTMQQPVACIVLAAGSSSRFGSDKRLARLADGATLLETTLSRIPHCFLQRLLVLRPDEETLGRRLAHGWEIICAPLARLGMGHSLSAAAGRIDVAGLRGVVIGLGDMPAVSPDTWLALAEAVEADRLVVPRYRGQRGNPVAIGAGFLDELLALQGDQGARQLFATQPRALHWLDVEDEGVLRDVDTPAQLQRSMAPASAGRADK